MTTALPAFITWPALTMMLIVVGARYRWFNSGRLEFYFNNTLATLVLSNLLRENAVQQFFDRHGIMTVTTTQQLSLAVVIFTAAGFMGFVEVWANPERYMEHHTNWRNRGLALVLAVAFLIAGTPARRAGMTLEEYGGWSSVAAWAFLITNLLMLAVQILRMSIAEMRASRKHRDRLVSLAGFGIGVIVGVTSLNALVLALIKQFGWADTTDLMLQIHGTNIFFEAVLVTGLAGLPIAVTMSGRIALDATSRSWRALQPLREDLEAVVPATTFTLHNTKRRKTNLDLHQTNVAIRDAILQLRPYFRTLDPRRVEECQRSSAALLGQRRYAEQALQLSDALAARAAGEPPAEVEAPSLITLKRSADLEDESVEMLRLARWWDCAKESTARNRVQALVLTGTGSSPADGSTTTAPRGDHT